VWDHSTFSKNRERLIALDVASAFFERILKQATAAGLLSDEHFTVDGTLIEAWASLKSFRRKEGLPPPSTGGRNPEVDFRGERRRNATHVSTTDPEARLFTKSAGQTARLCYMGDVLMDHRHGLVAAPALTLASGTAEREAAMAMLETLPHPRMTVGGDKYYDQGEFVRYLRQRGAVPHVAQKRRGSALLIQTTPSGKSKSRYVQEDLKNRFSTTPEPFFPGKQTGIRKHQTNNRSNRGEFPSLT
jgi:hypothetical protein